MDMSVPTANRTLSTPTELLPEALLSKPRTAASKRQPEPVPMSSTDSPRRFPWHFSPQVSISSTAASTRHSDDLRGIITSGVTVYLAPAKTASASRYSIGTTRRRCKSLQNDLKASALNPATSASALTLSVSVSVSVSVSPAISESALCDSASSAISLARTQHSSRVE